MSDGEDDVEKHEVIELSHIDIHFQNKQCMLVLLKNLTHYFRYQYSKAEGQLQEMITATVSHEMRTPINAILTMLGNLELLLNGDEQVLKLCQVIRNSGELLLYLVNDMLDVFMIKTGKFQHIDEWFELRDLLVGVKQMFTLQAE